MASEDNILRLQSNDSAVAVETELEAKSVKAADYGVPDYAIDSVDLTFHLSAQSTRVVSIMQIRYQGQSKGQQPDLVLNGEGLKLLSIEVDGRSCSSTQWYVTDLALTLKVNQAKFVLQTEVEIHPESNLTLSGLYASGSSLCTQCEPEGFRRITYFLDRPDVLSVYRVKLIAKQQHYPHLLSNGNLIESGQRPDGTHWVLWEDPYVKPCYLFAIVAGQYDVIEDTYMTMSQRCINLGVYVEKGNIDKSYYAMGALQEAMEWDERVYQRECDVERYMIAAVADFNAGAMENKGLNIFNDALVLADPLHATDQDFRRIARVIAHEYFHNWSGNRVSCRDWFQLSLKEGLTVYREQQFAYDMLSHSKERIADVRIMRGAQFNEDAGPLAHPVRPDTYLSIDNFYTATVYDKGAEVIRMMAVILGEADFMSGITQYFSRFDGKSVAVEDLIETMESVSKKDLTQFRLWYSQSGTPVVTINSEYDEDKQYCRIQCAQVTAPTPGQAQKAALYIPIRIALFSPDGQRMSVILGEGVENTAQDEHVLHLTQAEQTFVFSGVDKKPVLSLLRGFSAPIKIKSQRNISDYRLIAQYDDDAISCWDAVQCLIYAEIHRYVEADSIEGIQPEELIGLFKVLLADETKDLALKVECMIMPSEQLLLQRYRHDILKLCRARQWLINCVSKALEADWLRVYNQCNRHVNYHFNEEAAALRDMKNLCLWYLQYAKEDHSAVALHQFRSADNLTDRFGAIVAMNDHDHPMRETLLSRFYSLYTDHKLQLDKWLAIQASSAFPDTFETVKSLMQHSCYDVHNPNSVRALLGVFCAHNVMNFHREDGQCYEFLVDQVQKIDGFNRHLASALLRPLTQWHLLDTERQQKMQAQLRRLQEQEISKQLYEVVAKSLRDA